MVVIEDVQKKLLKNKIEIYPETFKLNSEQGGVNEVLSVNSNIGKLILHVAKHHDSSLQYTKAKKIYYLSQFLSKHPKIPTIEVIDFGKDSQGNVYTVEKYAKGEHYLAKEAKLKHIRHLAKIIAQLHQIELEGAGHITYSNNKVQATHKDWYKFLSVNANKALKEIFSANKISKETYVDIHKKLNSFFKMYASEIKCVKGRLLHGDVNLGNVLIDKDEVTALIDMEFSVVGDPAFEFTNSDNHNLLPTYFAEMKKLGADIDEERFLFRTKIYAVLKFLSIANSIKHTKNFPFFWKIFAENIEKMLSYR